MSTTNKRRRSRKTQAEREIGPVRRRERKGGRPPLNPEEGRMASFGVRLPATVVADLDARGLLEGKHRSELVRDALALLLAKPPKVAP